MKEYTTMAALMAFGLRQPVKITPHKEIWAHLHKRTDKNYKASHKIALQSEDDIKNRITRDPLFDFDVRTFEMPMAPREFLWLANVVRQDTVCNFQFFLKKNVNVR